MIRASIGNYRENGFAIILFTINAWRGWSLGASFHMIIKREEEGD